MLWLYAAEYEGGAITETLEDIAYRLRLSLEEFNGALKPLLDKGLFVLNDVASEALADCNNTFAPKTEAETEGEAETETRSIASDRPARVPSRFDEFWKFYPRRDGPNPRAPAEKKFNALVKSGLDPDFLIGEVKKFAADEGKRGNIGTRFIPQAITWLNQQRWADHAAVAFFEDEPLEQKLTIEQALQMWVRLKMWSRHAPGMAPGEAGCIATVEQLAAVGLGPDGRKLQPPEAEAA